MQPLYGMPEYAMPLDTAEDTVKDTGVDRDTEAVAVYSAPLDTENALPPYGMPMDTDKNVTVDTDTGEAVDVYGMPQPVYGVSEE